jgi:hypothetical protein
MKAPPRISAGSSFAVNQPYFIARKLGVAPAAAALGSISRVKASVACIKVAPRLYRHRRHARHRPQRAREIRKYKAIYLQADQRVGQWSDLVSIQWRDENENMQITLQPEISSQSDVIQATTKS